MTMLIVIAVVVVLILGVVSLYNRLVKLRNNRENAFADIDVQPCESAYKKCLREE